MNIRRLWSCNQCFRFCKLVTNEKKAPLVCPFVDKIPADKSKWILEDEDEFEVEE